MANLELFSTNPNQKQMTGHCNQNGAIKQPPRCTKSCCFLEIFFCPHRFRIPTEPVPAPSGRCVVGHDLSSDAIRAGPRLQRQRLSRFPDTCCILRGERKHVIFCFCFALISVYLVFLSLFFKVHVAPLHSAQRWPWRLPGLCSRTTPMGLGMCTGVLCSV